MAAVMTLPTHRDQRGALTVLEKVLPFEMKRLYWIYDLSNEPRARHRHHQTRQALICLNGSCEVLIRKYQQEECYRLDSPDQVLILEPEDWHETREFSEGALLLLVASHEFDPKDYIQEPLA